MKLSWPRSRLVRLSLWGSAALITSIALAGIVPRRAGLSVQPCSGSPYEIYILGDLQHVNLALPVKTDAFDWSSFLELDSIGSDVGGNYRYLKFGWGDRTFYRSTPTLAQANGFSLLRALFGPGNPTTVYVHGYDKTPTETGASVQCVALTRSNYLKLVEYLKRSFQTTSLDRPVHIEHGTAPQGSFYEGTGTYSILHTCNRWAAEALDAANLPSPLWSPFASAVMGQLD